jgi:hypothetical protein
MWRAFFLAFGTYLILLGAQCLGVDKFILKARNPGESQGIVAQERAPRGSNRVLDPPPWAPWSLMSTGAVVCLYSFTIPRRMNHG